MEQSHKKQLLMIKMATPFPMNMILLKILQNQSQKIATKQQQLTIQMEKCQVKQ